MQSTDISIVFMVAGLSSRFGGRVKQFALVGPNNETLMEVSMNQAIKAGFGKIIFIVGEKTEVLFKDKFGNSYNGIPVLYAKQTFDANERDKPWGTADALVSAKDLIKEPFVVCNGDDIYGEESFQLMADWLRKNNSPATLGFELGRVVPNNGAVSRAIYTLDKNNNVLDLTETHGIEKAKFKEMKLTDKTLCSMNFFGLTPSVLTMLAEKVKNFKIAHKGDRKVECYLPTEVPNLLKEGKITLKLIPTKSDWIGITNPEDEATVRAVLAVKK
jgi:NDP-sugar pyrophosphorylase family protein